MSLLKDFVGLKYPMSESNRKLRVFLCHSSQDKPIVRELYQRLNAEGWIDPWLDEEKLLPGQDWDMEIEKAVEAADAVIACLSNNSVTKEGYVQRELKYVLDIALEKPEGTIFIVPVRLEECQSPRRLRTYQYVDYFPKKRRKEAFDRLLESLKLKAERIDGVIFNIQQDMAIEIAEEISSAGIASPTLRETANLFDKWGHNVAGMEFMKIPAGGFIMGTDDIDASSDEKPQQIILIPYDYYIARFPVINEQYLIFAENMEIPFSIVLGEELHPANKISLANALKFCGWLTDRFAKDIPEGYIFRLPTEAEWEKAARGVDARKWPWGNKFEKGLCNSSEAGINATTPVDKYSPYGESPYGVTDMAGNVWEWTQSIYRLYPYDINDGRENLKKKGNRTLKGGSFKMDQNKIRTTFRLDHVDAPNFNVGFRVVVAPAIK